MGPVRTDDCTDEELLARSCADPAAFGRFYDRFEADLAEDEASQAPQAARERFASALKRYLNRRELDIDWETAQSAPLEALVNSLAMGLPFEPAEKQALLEAPDLAGRFETLSTLLEIDGVEDGDDEGPSLQ